MLMKLFKHLTLHFLFNRQSLQFEVNLRHYSLSILSLSLSLPLSLSLSFPIYYIIIYCILSSGTRGTDNEERSKSSMDVRHGDSPPLSRRKKMWHSFRRKMRSTSRSRDKSRGDSLEYEMDGEDPDGMDISYGPAVLDVDGGVNNDSGSPQTEKSTNESIVNGKSDTSEKRKNKFKNSVTSTLERRKKRGSQEEKHEKEGREKDKESEGDSGIAVVESVSTATIYLISISHGYRNNT